MELQTSVDQRVIEQLRAVFGEALQVNAPLAKYTSARVGGSAELFLPVHNADELMLAAELAHANKLPYFVIGGGSNVLVSDHGISGLVIMNKAKTVNFRHTGVGVVVTAESGANLSSLTRKCISKGLGGLEWAIGIPGTIGGAVVGNSGAHGGDMMSMLIAATIWEPGIGPRMYSVREMEYAYRDSVLKREQKAGGSRRLVLSAELALKPEPVEVLRARADGFTAHRKQSQPSGASMGSMFKNPEHYYAGYLIDAAGLKGLRVGGAEISHKHANFFINHENCTAEDIRELLAEAWNAVREQFGIEMEPEVELVGDWHFDDPDEAPAAE